MRKVLLLTLVIMSLCFWGVTGSNYFASLKEQLKTVLDQGNNAIYNTGLIIRSESSRPTLTARQLKAIKGMLHQQAPTLSNEVIDRTMAALACAQKQDVARNNMLTILDYSLPSSEKRLWVFDLAKNKLLFHTYVSHGIKSGTLASTYFSNKSNSKTSSIGVYDTEKAYRGRHGVSLKLIGLEKGFNSNAYNRFIVMHGAWYMDADFIKKYGRAGRSWGCPAVPISLIQPIIEAIQDGSLFIAYYPENDWLLKSKFLTCKNFSQQHSQDLKVAEVPAVTKEEPREAILFVDKNNNDKREENEPIVVVSADNYQRIFNTKAPLERMLRRQIDKMEYIALSEKEFESLDTNNSKSVDGGDKQGLKVIYFVIPVVKLSRGYYATEMHKVTLGQVKEVKWGGDLTGKEALQKGYTIYFDNKSAAQVKSTNRFIRWLGL